MANTIYIWHVWDNADPAETDKFFTDIHEAENYSAELERTSGVIGEPVEFTKQGIAHALNVCPIR